MINCNSYGFAVHTFTAHGFYFAHSEQMNKTPAQPDALAACRALVEAYEHVEKYCDEWDELDRAYHMALAAIADQETKTKGQGEK